MLGQWAEWGRVLQLRGISTGQSKSVRMAPLLPGVYLPGAGKLTENDLLLTSHMPPLLKGECVRAWVLTCLWRSEDNLRCHSSPITWFGLIQDLLLFASVQATCPMSF